MNNRMLRLGREILQALLSGALVVWICSAPLVWILQDGLGPDMVESGVGRALIKFLVLWGLPALLLATPLVGMAMLERRSAAKRASQGKQAS